MPPETSQPAPEMGAESALPDPAAARAAQIERLLAQWTIDCIHNSPVARVTDAFNHLTTSALPELGRRILKEIA
jgi:hypothetical protein